MTTANSIHVFDAQGTEFQLHSRVGEGGEGKVFHFSGNPDLVVKVHHAEDAEDRKRREAKLRAIVSKGSERLRGAAAWPRDLVFDEAGKVTGFTMEFLSGYMPLFTAYQTKTRLRKLPGKTFAYLVRIAKNLAACVHFVHEDGMVIGDLNETNVLITPGAMVKLIDVDSFQITVNGEVFPPNVGKPELLAPELQGQGLDGRARKPVEDCFSLAILIFQILSFGRHPFAGRPDDDEIELSLETAIEHGWYVYTDRRHVPIRRPPGLNLDHIPPQIGTLFEEAFDLGPYRPTAKMWHEALDALEKSLDDCPDNPQHVFWKGAPNCPWCALESKWHIPLFLSETPKSSDLEAFDLESVWDRIAKFEVQGLHDSLPSPSNYLGKPVVSSPFVNVISKLSWKGHFSFWFLHYFALKLIVGLFSSVKFPDQVLGFILMLLYLIVSLAFVAKSALNAWHTFRAKPLSKKYQNVAEQWQLSADKQIIEKKIEDYRAIKKRLDSMDERHQELRAAELRERYRPHLDSYLSRYSLIVADVDPDLRGQLENLVDRGMKSAADVSRAKLTSMLSSRSKLIDEVLYWVAKLEHQFWQASNLHLGIEKETALSNTIQAERLELQKQLIHAESELESLVTLIKKNQADILRIYEGFAPDYAERLARIESLGTRTALSNAQTQQQAVP